MTTAARSARVRAGRPGLRPRTQLSTWRTATTPPGTRPNTSSGVRMRHMQRTLFEPEHDAFRDMVRAFLERSVVPAGTPSGRRPASSTATSGSRPASRGCSAWTCRRSTAAAAVADFRYNAVLDEEIIRHRRHRPRLRPAQRHRRAVPAGRWRRDGAEAALAARVLRRRDHHRDRDERAWRGLRPAGGPDACRRGRRGLGAVRVQDVHHQRDQRRPVLVVAGPTRTRRRPRASACSRSSAGWPASSAAATWTRSG